MKPLFTKAVIASAIAGLGIAALPVSAHHTASMFESVKTIELAKSRPSLGFAPIGHWSIGVLRKNAQPR